MLILLIFLEIYVFRWDIDYNIHSNLVNYWISIINYNREGKQYQHTKI
jgi:hypothetical protein